MLRNRVRRHRLQRDQRDDRPPRRVGYCLENVSFHDHEAHYATKRLRMQARRDEVICPTDRDHILKKAVNCSSGLRFALASSFDSTAVAMVMVRPTRFRQGRAQSRARRLRPRLGWDFAGFPVRVRGGRDGLVSFWYRSTKLAERRFRSTLPFCLAAL